MAARGRTHQRGGSLPPDHAHPLTHGAGLGCIDVRLIIDRSFAVAATIQGTNEAGLVEGNGDADLRMSLVEPGTLIEGDEAVLTQGYELDGEAGLYPPGMLIGQVSRLVPGDNATQEFVEVRPAVDFETLQFVLVLQARTEA